jgi:hypothetical protein
MMYGSDGGLLLPVVAAAVADVAVAPVALKAWLGLVCASPPMLLLSRLIAAVAGCALECPCVKGV